MRRACIDIGSNTTRLLVADCEGSRLQEVHQERSFTRLGTALGDDGRIGAEKLAEVAQVVSEQLASARARGAVDVRCVATAAVRRAANGAELVDWIDRRCPGLRVEVLSGQDEARLAFVGAARTVPARARGTVGVVDVGGGSSELVVGTPPNHVTWWASLPLGSSDIADGYLHSDPPTDGQLREARLQVARVLAGVRPPPAGTVIAVGGSANSTLRLVGPVIDAESLALSLELLATQRAEAVARRFAVDVERVRLLPAGLVILEAVAKLFDAPLHIGQGGVREGVLLDH